MISEGMYQANTSLQELIESSLIEKSSQPAQLKPVIAHPQNDKLSNKWSAIPKPQEVNYIEGLSPVVSKIKV